MVSQRKFPLYTGYYYHIINRGVEKRKLFFSHHDYERAVDMLWYYQFVEPPCRFSYFCDYLPFQKQEIIQSLVLQKKLVQIVSYCLMPNHFHLLLQQTTDNGITIFLSRFSNSYARFFNTKMKRKGPLFEGPFRSVFMEDDEQLIHTSRYIHLNPVKAGLVLLDNLEAFRWSSFPEYMGKRTSLVVNPSPILSRFPSTEEYRSLSMREFSHPPGEIVGVH